MELDHPKGRRGLAHCRECGRELPEREGRQSGACPTCNAGKKRRRKAEVARQKPRRKRASSERVGTIIGGVLGLPLGAFFASLIYRDKDSRTLALLMIVYALGFAFICGCFGFMAVAKASRDR
jgi:predicted RNA-binding Zn-ribbon protein involved in translation (DUF1610 family)